MISRTCFHVVSIGSSIVEAIETVEVGLRMSRCYLQPISLQLSDLIRTKNILLSLHLEIGAQHKLK